MEALKGSCGMRQRSDGKEGSVFWFCFPYRPDPAAEDFEKRECPNSLGGFGSFDTNMNTSLEEMNAGTKGDTIGSFQFVTMHPIHMPPTSMNEIIMDYSVFTTIRCYSDRN